MPTMSKIEFARLRAYRYARTNAPRNNAVSRRSAKSKRNGTGQLGLKSARILYQVPLERVFIEHKI